MIEHYNQRAETSENRIKEFKLDFHAECLPCDHFKANAAYLMLCMSAFNLFVILRNTLPHQWDYCRIKKIRWDLYAIACRITHRSRKLVCQVQKQSYELLQRVRWAIQQLPVPNMPPQNDTG